MDAVVAGEDWDLTAVTDGSVIKTVPARDLMRDIAQAAWECADPGVQFDTTINRWHTTPNAGRINASNPCSEYMHVDDSACNLASLNLLAFHRPEETGREFETEEFAAAVELLFAAQEMIIDPADYPTERIGENTRRFRQIGLGYANLGALLMALGAPYDSDRGRAVAGAITALMGGASYRMSTRVAKRVGPFAGYDDDRVNVQSVLAAHRDALETVDTRPGTRGSFRRSERSLERRLHQRRDRWGQKRPGDRSSADGNDQFPHGLRHHRHRARSWLGQDEEARWWWHDADH